MKKKALFFFHPSLDSSISNFFFPFISLLKMSVPIQPAPSSAISLLEETHPSKDSLYSQEHFFHEKETTLFCFQEFQSILARGKLKAFYELCEFLRSSDSVPIQSVELYQLCSFNFKAIFDRDLHIHQLPSTYYSKWKQISRPTRIQNSFYKITFRRASEYPRDKWKKTEQKQMPQRSKLWMIKIHKLKENQIHTFVWCDTPRKTEQGDFTPLEQVTTMQQQCTSEWLESFCKED